MRDFISVYLSKIIIWGDIFRVFCEFQQTEKNSKKYWKKVLTIGNDCDIISELCATVHDEKHRKLQKTFLKKFKKGIDKGDLMWYNM